jgi:hypothetical protein
MIRSRLNPALPFALAATVLVVAPGCKYFKKGAPEESKEIKELTQKAAELDKATQEQQKAGAGQQSKLGQAGAGDVALNPATMQLTDEQKKALEERIKNEKNTTYQALLQEVLDKDKQIKELNDKVNKLKALLPRPDLAGPNDSHYGMALRFLKKRGVSEDEAKQLVSRVNLMEKMAPGFEVYHFYANGVYGSWVAQGKAKITPNDLQRQEREKVEGERDTAVAQNEKLQEDVNDLATVKKQLESDVTGLRKEKTDLETKILGLSETNEKQKSKLNSMHYILGVSKALQDRGVIVVPVFAKDRAGAKWSDEVFEKEAKDLDLRSNKSLTISAAELGLKRIGKVSVVPGSLTKDEHYKLAISEDKATATLTFLVPERFRNEKVVFAVTE